MSFFDRLSSYHYELPVELIAQYPCQPRHASRLLIVDRQKQSFEACLFSDLAKRLSEKDLLVFNNSRVIPARVPLSRPGNGKAEMLVIEIVGDLVKALLKPSAKLKLHQRLIAPEGIEVEPLERLEDGLWLARIHGLPSALNDPSNPLSAAHLANLPILNYLERVGQIPLPHYIRGGIADASDLINYQTLLATRPGSSAAPTAALHFSESLFAQLEAKGVRHTELTLHVGLGTFLPVRHEELTLHRMHEERFEISQELADLLKQRRSQTGEALLNRSRLISVGTTSLRALESACQLQDLGVEVGGKIERTRLFIRPGHQFQSADSLITNFHLPSSTLLMLTCAFGGYDLIMQAYAYAIKERFRFFSYGDAMWII